jgi:IS605 OrfB family transposase
LPIYSVGEAPKNSNRKFNFQFDKQQIIFKPNKDTKISINYYCSKNQQTVLSKLQMYLGTQAISVRLSNDYVWISFDEEKLNNYEFKKNDFIKELKILTKEQNTAEKRKKIYKKHIAEQRDRQLENKLNNRYLAVDLNPEFIGFCIVDKQENGSIKNIHLECIDLTNLSKALKLSSTDIKQKYQNNKRKYEICQAWKYIFNLATHYKVGHFVMEELNFKEKSVNVNSNEANRKTRNIWHRTLTTNLILKYCNSLGIEQIPVNAAYSSFIGNIQHNYFDPINASLEIARRGIVKYTKGGSIFPVLDGNDFDTMCLLGLDVQNNITFKQELHL